MLFKRIISILFTGGLLLVAVTANACSCSGRQQPLKDIVESSNFVAYVKVIRKEPVTTADTGRLKTSHDLNLMTRIVYQVKEMFKGDSTFFLYEWGINTSCDMGITVGSEWIFFGSGKEPATSSVSYCGKWIRMRSAGGQQDYSYNSGMQTLKELRELMHLPPKPVKDGKFVYYYTNGKKESESFYRNDKLEKEQVLYYHNGIIRAVHHFKDGVPDGQQKEFALSGQLLSDTWYSKNEWVSRKEWFDTSFSERRWYLLMTMDRLPRGREDLDTMLNRYKIPIQLRSEFVYHVEEGKSTMRIYKWNGVLEQLNIEDRRNNTWQSYRYHPNGKISEENFNRRNDEWEENKAWDAEGKLIKHKTWQKGKYLGDKVQQP